MDFKRMSQEVYIGVKSNHWFLLSTLTAVVGILIVPALWVKVLWAALIMLNVLSLYGMIGVYVKAQYKHIDIEEVIENGQV